jgi:hypothetical protein
MQIRRRYIEYSHPNIRLTLPMDRPASAAGPSNGMRTSAIEDMYKRRCKWGTTRDAEGR